MLEFTAKPPKFMTFHYGTTNMPTNTGTTQSQIPNSLCQTIAAPDTPNHIWYPTKTRSAIFQPGYHSCE